MDIPRSMALFVPAALAEIRGAWLVLQACANTEASPCVGAAICLPGVAVIMFAPRASV